MDATAFNLRSNAPRFAAASASFLDVRFRRTFEAAAVGIGICDLNGRIVEANPALARLLGYKCEELVGIDPWHLLETELVKTELAKTKPVGTRLAEARLVETMLPEAQLAETHSDEPSLAGGMAAAIGLAGAESWCAPVNSLPRPERDLSIVERACQRRDGSEFLGRITISVARDDEGQPAFLVVLLGNARERPADEHTRQAEKMELIGRLAAGVAHDFNNLLTGILLYCDLLLPSLEADGPPHRYVEEIRLASEQGAAVTHQLLAIARKQEPAGASGMNEIVASSENLLRRLIGERIELITTLEAKAETACADGARLRQLLMNLVLNARDALGQGKVPSGKIWVSTRVAQRLEHEPEAVSLSVEDNGCGMSAETRSHLFEPFFTTKNSGEGTGIGLATVQRIVAELGGSIAISSTPGSGTRVEVFLPAAARRREPAMIESTPAAAGKTVCDGIQGRISGNSQLLNSRITDTPK
jgi:signal transduction histidine kinase